MGRNMELRHLRYFVAVAEEGSLTVAAERRLHTAQPSLSRQIRDLEYEVGAQLMIRSGRGLDSCLLEVVGIDSLYLICPRRGDTNLEVDHKLSKALPIYQDDLWVDMLDVGYRLG